MPEFDDINVCHPKIVIVSTRKRRQSYRHAEPRRHRPQAAQRRTGL